MNTVYWLTTSIISAFLVFSSYTYVFSESTISGIKTLGFPDYFRIQLAVLKIIAAAILLTPNIPIQLKEWAYAGVGLFLITAIVAHSVHKDPFIITGINLVLIGILIISNAYLHETMTLN